MDAPAHPDAPFGELPHADNNPEGVRALLAANRMARASLWPAPFDRTMHLVKRGDARELDWIPAESVHLVVTSPPYWTL